MIKWLIFYIKFYLNKSNKKKKNLNKKLNKNCLVIKLVQVILYFSNHKSINQKNLFNDRYIYII